MKALNPYVNLGIGLTTLVEYHPSSRQSTITMFLKAKDKKQPETASPGRRAVNYYIYIMWNGISLMKSKILQSFQAMTFFISDCNFKLRTFKVTQRILLLIMTRCTWKEERGNKLLKGFLKTLLNHFWGWGFRDPNFAVTYDSPLPSQRSFKIRTRVILMLPLSWFLWGKKPGRTSDMAWN